MFTWTMYDFTWETNEKSSGVHVKWNMKCVLVNKLLAFITFSYKYKALLFEKYLK